MHLIRHLCLAGALLLPIASAAAEEPTAAQVTLAQDPQASRIIQAADRIRAPDRPFRYDLELVEMRQGVEASRQKLDVAMRFYKPTPERPGDAKALVRFVEPQRDRGKALLSVFDKLWFYDPKLRKPIPIARQQRLIGQVSNGDVVASDFDFSYVSSVVGQEPCGDAQCHRIALERRWTFVAYPRITYWVEVGTHRPVRAEFQSTTGLVLKTAHYKAYRPILGVERPGEIVVVDELKKDNYTRMVYANVRFEDTPDAYFQRDYLERLQ